MQSKNERHIQNPVKQLGNNLGSKHSLLMNLASLYHIMKEIKFIIKFIKTKTTTNYEPKNLPKTSQNQPQQPKSD